MRQARADFTHALRECRDNEEALRAQAAAEKLACGDARGFWRVMGRGDAPPPRPDQIDGATGEQNIANLWAAKFEGVLNSQDDEIYKKEFFDVLDKTNDVAFVPITVKKLKYVVKI